MFECKIWDGEIDRERGQEARERVSVSALIDADDAGLVATSMQDFGTLTQAQFGDAAAYAAGNSGHNDDHVRHRRRRREGRAQRARRAREPTELMSCLRERAAGVAEIGQLSRLTKNLSRSVEDTITSSLRSLRKDMGESRRERQRVEREKADQEARQAARRATAKLNDINSRSSSKMQHQMQQQQQQQQQQQEDERPVWSRPTRRYGGSKRPVFVSTVNAADAKNAIAMAPRPHSPFHGAACVDGFRSLKPVRGRAPFLAGDKSSNLAPVGTTLMKSSASGNSDVVAHVWRAKSSMPSTSAGATAAASVPDPVFYAMSGIMTPSQSHSQSWDPETASLAAAAMQAVAEPPAHLRGPAWQERQLGRAALSLLLGDDPLAQMQGMQGMQAADDGAPRAQVRQPPQAAFELSHEPLPRPKPEEFAPSAIVGEALSPIPDGSESASPSPSNRVRRIDAVV